MPTINLTDTELLVLAEAVGIALEVDEAFGNIDSTIGLPGYESMTGGKRRELVDLRDRLRCVVAEHA